MSCSQDEYQAPYIPNGERNVLVVKHGVAVVSRYQEEHDSGDESGSCRSETAGECVDTDNAGEACQSADKMPGMVCGERRYSGQKVRDQVVETSIEPHVREREDVACSEA